MSNLYAPKAVFAPEGERVPRVFASPHRYIQGPGVIDHTGRYIKALMNVNRAVILASKRGHDSQGAQVAKSLDLQSMGSESAVFMGECSIPEIEKHAAELEHQEIDCLIAVGGGKVLDAGRCIAYRLDIPIVVVSTLASTDAPCSALSVVYTPEGKTDHVEVFPQNPAIVIVDTDVVTDAPERYLVAGMGDAMATWYEANICLNNPVARNALGGLPTLASCAIGETCAHTLFSFGEEAASSVRKNENNEAVERVVEANTLLSGIGFESGGLALAHAIAVAYPAIDIVHDNYLHGEMVSMGTMAQLAMQKSNDAERVARFFAKVGLPIHLGQISMSPKNGSEIDTLVEASLSRPIAYNMPMPVNHETVRSAILAGHELGIAIAKEIGDEAYKRLQS